MRPLLNGSFHFLAVLLVLSAVALFLFTPLKRNVYSTYQNLGYYAGINFNNIATPKYVNFIKSQDGQFQDNLQAVFLNSRVNAQNSQVAEVKPNILGDSSSSNKWIDINLTEQRLYMKEGSNVIGNFLISSGKWAPTPTGVFAIWTKLRYARMTGGSESLGTFYDLPNVPYTMYFHQGFGIHGTYWHNNFGHPMSHGCVNMKTEEAGIVYNWADVGTRVVVHN